MRTQEAFGQGAGQEVSPQAQDPRARIRTTASLVVVPVTVKDSGGELVTDLQQNDFRVFEDGIEQEIASFSSEDVPISIGLVFDMSGSMSDKVDKARQAAQPEGASFAAYVKTHGFSFG